VSGGVQVDSVTTWVRELEAAGWRKHTSTSWYSPWGQLYRGPYKAWCVMRGMPCEAPKA
jgi:hypothetical protein